MKLVNAFHNTSMKSNLNGSASMDDLAFEARSLGKTSKAYKTLTRIEKTLCPHSKNGCNCSAFISIEG